jgi:hypothetical protein
VGLPAGESLRQRLQRAACATRLRAGECGQEQTALAAVECGRREIFSTEVSSMDVRKFVSAVLADAKIHRSRCEFKQFEEDYAHVVIHGDVSSAEFTVLRRHDGLVWVQVWYAGLKLVVYAPPELIWQEPVYEDIVDAVRKAKDWESEVIDWTVLVDELDDATAELLQS